MVDKYLRSKCKSARKRLAEIRSQMQEHHGRGLMVVHYDAGYHKAGYHVMVVPDSIQMEKGQLVFPCAEHLSYLRHENGPEADKLAMVNGNFRLNEVSTHQIFFPDGDQGRSVGVYIGDTNVLAWYGRVRYQKVISVAARLGHTILPEDLVSCRKEYQLHVAEMVRYDANCACIAAEKLYKGQPQNRQEKENLSRELERTRRNLNELLTEAETAGLDPAVIDGHRKHYDERLAAYT